MRIQNYLYVMSDRSQYASVISITTNPSLAGKFWEMQCTEVCLDSSGLRWM